LCVFHEKTPIVGRISVTRVRRTEMLKFKILKVIFPKVKLCLLRYYILLIINYYLKLLLAIGINKFFLKIGFFFSC